MIYLSATLLSLLYTGVSILSCTYTKGGHTFNSLKNKTIIFIPQLYNNSVFVDLGFYIFSIYKTKLRYNVTG